MRRGRARTLGTLVLLACTLAYVLASALFFSLGTGTPEQMLGTLVQLGAFFAFPVVGALIVTQRPSSTVGWIFCAIGLGTASTSFTAAYVQHAISTQAGAQLATGLIDAFGSTVWSLNLGLGLLLLMVFPDGKPLPGLWRLIFWIDAVTVAAVCLADLVRPGPLEANGLVVNPLGLSALAPLLAAIDLVGHLLIVPMVLAAVVSVIVRYRRAEGVQQRQIKWFAYGAGLMALVIAVTLFASDALPPPGQDSSNSLIATVGFSLAFVLLPVGAGIGVLRYRLYDIDVLINRTLVCGSLTAMLAALYFGSVVAMQQIVRVVTGRAEQAPWAIVLSTLMIAAAFSPLRRRLQQFIDRRFFRAKYYAGHTLQRFAATLRREVDLGDLSDHLVAVVEETMRLAHDSLWIQTPPATRRGTSDAWTPPRGGAR